MNIKILQSMEWSKLYWENSFKDLIQLHEILPKIGFSYPVTLERNEDYANEGKAFILWRPPHSDLNGWNDKRPSEILKSYIIEGNLKQIRGNYLQFSFKVTDLIPLTTFFNKVPLSKSSPLSRIGQADGSYKIHWKTARHIKKSKIGNYWYLCGSECETTLETILSYSNNHDICIHYSATLHTPAFYETLITNYYLNPDEQKIFDHLISTANEIVDDSLINLTDNQVHGAEYY